MNRFFTIAIFVVMAANAMAQKAATVHGELLVQLKPSATVADVEKEALEELGLLPHLKAKEVVSDYMRIWLFTFNEDEIAKRDMIRMMNTFSSVSVAQANHIIADRVVPDDPFFGQQWHLKQDNDHDIDADLAWDITTGGLTETGDTIVVCVIETGGAKWDVADIVDNHWVNIHEIPDNGIDDDNNGYVDDYHGWNSSGDNDEVFGNGNHGAQVSSMIGAKGNNGQGISGVNWNVKLMQVRMGGISESGVIAAYTYPLIMRKKYNETDGAEGAFVVATNSSWGTDFGQPADAPLWCAMYDSLGTYGVLSCGATANNNVDVDALGDLPTACASDYLISVTSTNSTDVKVNSAGYGVVTIDLAAPGNSVYLANNNGYGNTSGTSFATPCVAGSVALLYSAPCSSLMPFVFQSPAVAALQMKDFILAGIDQTELLQTQTLAGGRLNVNNSLNALLAQCGSCLAPVAMYAEQQEGTLNYTLNWISVSEVQSVSLQYRLQGSTEWTLIEELDANSYPLLNLLACSTYEFQMLSECSEEQSEWSDIVTFDTDGCCYHPLEVIISSIEEETAYVVWDAVLASPTYTVVVIDETGADWTFDTIPDPVLYLEFLEPCMEYQVYVYSNCVGELEPPTAVSFITPGCGACTDLEYCAATGADNTEYIRRVKFGDIDYESTEGEGYSFITEQTTELVAGNTYPIELYPGFPDGDYNQNFRMWIDLNADGVFQDPGERLFDAAEPTQTVATGNITIPAGTPEGYVRMRVTMRYAFFSTTEPPVCGIWDYGEAEDYCVSIVASNSVDDAERKLNIAVYPNPAESELYVRINGQSLAGAEAFIYNSNGQVMLQKRMTGKQDVDISSLASGLYTIVLQTGAEVYTTRFIKR